ncbi:multidrug/biocide efflux PACE transporter [Erwinia oleae]|uniref:multidrug/biocide efflux PACE transporter n=1 Tax=Erwinia oleae TaxID=796334 RepID=UPI00054E8646|nr:multidrug/biocide efflux PACE transporter [Erwinia oleae]
MRTWNIKTRVIHAVGYESVAILLLAPAAAWALDKPLFQMGSLAVMLSTVAMIWNVIYNAGFDKLFPRDKVTRGLALRVLQALGFEGGFILIGLPIAAAMLGISLGQALLIEIAFFLAYLPYTVFYNWLFDLLHARWLKYKMCRTQ